MSKTRNKYVCFRESTMEMLLSKITAKRVAKKLGTTILFSHFSFSFPGILFNLLYPSRLRVTLFYFGSSPIKSHTSYLLYLDIKNTFIVGKIYTKYHYLHKFITHKKSKRSNIPPPNSIYYTFKHFLKIRAQLKCDSNRGRRE